MAKELFQAIKRAGCDVLLKLHNINIVSDLIRSAPEFEAIPLPLGPKILFFSNRLMYLNQMFTSSKKYLPLTAFIVGGEHIMANKFT